MECERLLQLTLHVADQLLHHARTCVFCVTQWTQTRLALCTVCLGFKYVYCLCTLRLYCLCTLRLCFTHSSRETEKAVSSWCSIMEPLTALIAKGLQADAGRSGHSRGGARPVSARESFAYWVVLAANGVSASVSETWSVWSRTVGRSCPSGFCLPYLHWFYVTNLRGKQDFAHKCMDRGWLDR